MVSLDYPIVFPGSTTVSLELFTQTSGAKLFLSWLKMFNNVVYLENNRFYRFRSTVAVAQAVAKAGYDVYDLGDGVYGARRTSNLSIEGMV